MPQMVFGEKSVRSVIFWNTASQVIARGISAATTFVITLVIARRFGAGGLGDFVKITTYLAFFYLVADFGLNAIYLQRSPSASPAGQPRGDFPIATGPMPDAAWEDLLMLRVILSGILVVAAALALFLFPRGTTQGYTDFVRVGIVLFTPSIVFQALITTANALFQKYFRYDLSAVALTFGSMVSLLFLFLVVRQPDSSTGVLFSILSLLLGAAVTAAAGLLLTRKFHRIVHSSFSFPRMKSLFIASAPLGITLMFNLIYFRVDSVILTVTRSTAEVGVYGLAYKVFELFLVFPTFFMNSVYPIMVRADTTLPHLVKRSTVLLGVLSVVATAIFWVAAPIIAFVRSDFAAGVVAARILSLGLPFFFLSSLTMWILIAKKKQMLLAKIYGVSMVLNIILNVLFIPQYGYVAAAWITGISEAIVLVMSGTAAVKLLTL